MNNDFYILGLLLSKGKVVSSDNSNSIDLILELRFNKPTDQSLRSDNIANEINIDSDPVNIYNYLLPDIIKIWNLLQEVFIENKVELEHIPEPKNISDFARKKIRWIIRGVKKDQNFIKYFWENEKLTLPTDLDNVPKKIRQLQDKAMKKELNEEEVENIKSFIIGIADASGVIPGPESATRGGGGEPRIQLEADTSRWKLHIPLMVFLQEVFAVPILNINWPHPTIKSRSKPKACLGHNHQFRPSLWHFYKKLKFNLSIKQRNLESYIELIDNKYKKNDVTENDFYPNRLVRKKFVSKSEYLAKYPNVTSLTTEPFECTDHEEDSLKLPLEVRNKHYGSSWDLLFEFGDPYLNDYISNTLK